MRACAHARGALLSQPGIARRTAERARARGLTTRGARQRRRHVPASRRVLELCGREEDHHAKHVLQAFRHRLAHHFILVGKRDLLLCERAGRRYLPPVLVAAIFKNPVFHGRETQIDGPSRRACSGVGRARALDCPSSLTCRAPCGAGRRVRPRGGRCSDDARAAPGRAAIRAAINLTEAERAVSNRSRSADVPLPSSLSLLASSLLLSVRTAASCRSSIPSAS